jgi:hypothetical protein
MGLNTFNYDSLSKKRVYKEEYETIEACIHFS